MKIKSVLQSGLTLAVIAFAIPAFPAPELQTGQDAPVFELMDQYKKMHTLSDYAGQWLVVYFYPKDQTPGCTTEACNFRDDYFKLRDLNAEVLGVSLDSVESHAEFAGMHGLPFPLLSDSKGIVAGSYGCLTQRGGTKFARRDTFIIDPEGKIARVFRGVNPDQHSAEVISALKDLQNRD